MGSKTQIPSYRCPGCGVTIGNPHSNGCDVEHCPECGRQKISCDCDVQNSSTLPAIVWSGFWTGEVECFKYGLFCAFKNGSGWVRCAADFPGATADLTALFSCGQWDKKAGRWVLPTQEISGLCYCENELCSKMWPVSCGVEGPKDTNGKIILPCGHRLERIVASAECFRNDNRDAEDYQWLRDHCHISDDAMDELAEHRYGQDWKHPSAF